MKKLCNAMIAALLFVFALSFVGCKEEPATKPQPEHNTLYSIDTVYKNGWLDAEDWQTLAAYHAEDYDTIKNDISATVTVEKLDEIRRCYLTQKMNDPDGALNSVDLSHYYGEYNGFYAAVMMPEGIDEPFMPSDYTVGDVTLLNCRKSYFYFWYE